MKPLFVLASAATLATVSAASGETSEFNLGLFWMPSAIEQSVMPGANGPRRNATLDTQRMSAPSDDAMTAVALKRYLAKRERRQAVGQNTALVAYLQERDQRQVLHFAELAQDRALQTALSAHLAKRTQVVSAQRIDHTIRPALIAYLAERTRRQMPVQQTLAAYLSARDRRQTPTSVTLATYLRARDDMQNGPSLQLALSAHLAKRAAWSMAAGVRHPIYAANGYGSDIMTGSLGRDAHEDRLGTGFTVPKPLQSIISGTRY